MDRYDLFLSYDRHDASVVEELAVRLKSAGVAVWLDTWDLVPGADWHAAIEQAMDKSSGFAPCIGSEGSTVWRKGEIEVALSVKEKRPAFRIVPILLPGTTYDNLPPSIQNFAAVDMTGGVSDLAIQAIAQATGSVHEEMGEAEEQTVKVLQDIGYQTPWGSEDTHLSTFKRLAKLQSRASDNMTAAEREKSRGEWRLAIRHYEEAAADLSELLHLEGVYNEQAAEPFDVAPLATTYVNIRSMEADLWNSNGNPEKAEAVLRDASSVSRAILGKDDSSILRRRSESCLRQGDFCAALEILGQAAKALEQEGRLTEQARVVIDRADILGWIGDDPQALSELQHVSGMLGIVEAALVPKELFPQVASLEDIGAIESHMKSIQNERARIEVEYYLGLVFRRLKNYSRARAKFEAVLPAYVSIGGAAAIEYQITAIDVEVGNFTLALDRVNRLESEFRDNDLLRPKLSALLRVKAEAMLGIKEPTKALAAVTEALSLLETYPDTSLWWAAKWTEGRVRAALRQFDQAVHAYLIGARDLETLRQSSLGYRLTRQFESHGSDLREEAVVLAAKTGRVAECIELMEIIRARRLQAILSPPHTTTVQTGTFEKTLVELNRRIDALAFQEWQGQTLDLERRRPGIEERWRLLDTRRSEEPRAHAVTGPGPLVLDELVARLKATSTAALSVQFVGDTLVAALVMDGTTKCAVHPLGSELKQALAEYSTNLMSEAPDPDRFDLSVFWGIQASDLIPGQLLADAVQAVKLLVVPTGILHAVPWAGLMHKGHRLFERCSIGVLPTLKILSLVRDDNFGSPRIVLAAAQGPRPPVALSDEEEVLLVDKIVQLEAALGRQVELCQGVTLTRAHLETLLEAADAEQSLLHLALPAKAGSEGPASCSLQLSDSSLEAWKLLSRTIRYQEVVLSRVGMVHLSTSTEGLPWRGDELVALPAAFLESGVHGVLASLTSPIPSTAGDFLVKYHYHRGKGHSPMTALRATQMELFYEGVHPPGCWIGFTAYSDL